MKKVFLLAASLIGATFHKTAFASRPYIDPDALSLCNLEFLIKNIECTERSFASLFVLTINTYVFPALLIIPVIIFFWGINQCFAPEQRAFGKKKLLYAVLLFATLIFIWFLSGLLFYSI